MLKTFHYVSHIKLERIVVFETYEYIHLFTRIHGNGKYFISKL